MGGELVNTSKNAGEKRHIKKTFFSGAKTGSVTAQAGEDGAIWGHHPVLLPPHFPPRFLSLTPPNITEACLSSPSAKYSLPLWAALRPGSGALGVY